MTEQTIEQLRAKLADTHVSLAVAVKNIAIMRAELTDACAARDALARKRDDVKQEADIWFDKMQRRKRELAQAHTRIGQLCSRLVETQDELVAANRGCDDMASECNDLEDKLSQARAELKDLQGANRALGQQLTDEIDNCKFWHEAAMKAETGRDYWRKRCKHDTATLDAAEALLKVSNAKLQKRQGSLDRACIELDAAEAALADCGLTGIYNDFGGPADAIKQMVKRLVHLEGDQALQSERQLRQEAERRHETALILARNRGIQLETWEQRLERAETLAQLVTPGLATLLGRLANRVEWFIEPSPDHDARIIKQARKLTVQIREALDDSQA